MAFASCAQFEHGYFTAYRRLAEDEPDLVLHLGDYTYEYESGIHVAPSGNVRHVEGPTTVTLARLPAAARRSTRPTPTCRPRTPWRRGR